MMVCPECDTALDTPPRSKARIITRITCNACNSPLLWNGSTIEIPEPSPRVPLRTTAPAIKVGAVLEIPGLTDVEPTPVNLDRIRCIGCDQETDKLTSHAIKLRIGFGQKERETKQLDNLGFPINEILSYPIFKDGRICSECFRQVERRKDSQNHYRWYLDRKQVIFTWENTPGETQIPEKERYRTPNPTQKRVLDRGKQIPGTDIILHVDLTPDFPEPETEPDVRSFQKFGGTRPRDYRKYIRG